MPKSKHRKDHKKKSAQRTKEIKVKREKARQDWMNMLQNAQEEAMRRYEEEHKTSKEDTVGDIGDIPNLDDIQAPVESIPNEIGDIGDIGDISKIE